MTKDYVFWGGFAIVLAGIVITLIGNYRRALAREKAVEARRAELAAVVPAAGPPGPTGGARESSAPFDPAATRIYLRQEPVAPAHELTDRAAPAGPLRGTPVLTCVGGRQKGHRYPIAGIGLSIGRADDNDVVIIDGRVSAHHAWIGLVDGKVVLRDYQSLNGTFINARMDDSVSEAALIDGDTIFFGGHGGDQYRFVLE